jgi:hypothetical protein
MAAMIVLAAILRDASPLAMLLRMTAEKRRLGELRPQINLFVPWVDESSRDGP